MVWSRLKTDRHTAGRRITRTPLVKPNCVSETANRSLVVTELVHQPSQPDGNVPGFEYSCAGKPNWNGIRTLEQVIVAQCEVETTPSAGDERDISDFLGNAHPNIASYPFAILPVWRRTLASVDQVAGTENRVKGRRVSTRGLLIRWDLASTFYCFCRLVDRVVEKSCLCRLTRKLQSKAPMDRDYSATEIWAKGAKRRLATVHSRLVAFRITCRFWARYDAMPCSVLDCLYSTHYS